MAIAMLICLFHMPYGYYQIVRLGSAIGFGYLAASLKEGNDKLRWVYIGLAILFQPLVKVSLGRAMWNALDVIIGIVLFGESSLGKPIHQKVN
jgi:hypothetical protein